MTNAQKQRQLKFLGYYGGKIDGEFGVASKEATAEFQRDFGLVDDSIFGDKTEEKTVEVIKVIQNAIGAKADGLAGPDTEEKTEAYQKVNGLTADRIAGTKTRAKIGIKTVDFWSTIKYFKRDEFKCKCGGEYCNGFPVELSQTLARVADRVRRNFAQKITVSSGVRCSKHNAKVGGVSNSRHKLGKAMDFCVSGIPASTVLAYVKKQPEIRYAYAINKNFVHMDVY